VKLILTHDNADFDAVASLLGAYKLDPTAIPVLPRRVNRNVAHFLNLYAAGLPFVQPDDLRKGEITTSATVVDTQSFSTMRGMNRKTPIHFIDHHPISRDLASYHTFSGEIIGATTTLLVEQIAHQQISIVPLEATLLMLGIYEDTGSLSYGTTTARDIRCAAWLMEAGAEIDVVREFLQHPLMSDQRALYEQLLEHTETLIIHGQVIMLACGHVAQPVDEIATVAHKLRELYEPGAVFVLVQLNGDIQLVARGTTDSIDVSRVAKYFGGGGHGRAAAALIRERDVESVRQDIIQLLETAVIASIQVSSLMSMGVQTVRPKDRVEAASRRMQRTGHEGFPVVDNNKVVGLLTRRAVDRAMSHGMGRQYVQEIMDAGEVTVKPGDSIEILQQRMMRSGWGQIPVVNEEGDLIGIVTRTDLIKRWGQHPDENRRDILVRLMRAVLPPDLWDLLHVIAKEAQAKRLGLYLVGGFVRDLLLGHPNADIDLVVEGDAIELVRTLYDIYGGEMRSHAQFGTGKWLLTNEVADALGMDFARVGWPETIDFASARTEFYEQPTALPTVERGSIKLDLHRRDFTINTLAIRLSPEPLGELLDFYGGEQDLKEGTIRVLHSLSFVDDPTRMMRAVRLEQRLGFEIEARTDELIRSALPLLDRVSGDRIRHEFNLILGESPALRSLKRLEHLGILKTIHPKLWVDEWLCGAFRALWYAQKHHPWSSLDTFDEWRLTRFALLLSRLSKNELEDLGRRLQFSRPDLDCLHDARTAVALLPDLGQEQLPSVIVRILDPLHEVGWLAAWAAAPKAIARDNITLFAQEWRFIKPTVNGRSLEALTGLKPGPVYSILLGNLRQAWLDGLIVSTTEEHELLLKLAKEHSNGDSSTP
jgi:tRNA nucleotidyltransferase (CCA-adding enzyme)